ncbi:MAG TPA: lyase family protein, partial [Chitinophagales bacterium]|nr:lyase family protein [Chitinophagales bacterium]
MAKLWQKGNIKETELTQKVERFTVGNDRALDLLLAKHDVLGTIAHIKMLNKVNLLQTKDVQAVIPFLKEILKEIEDGKFSLSKGSEDIHSEVEFRLVKKLGDVGKKIHTGRSRNDQVLLDIKLFTREKLEQIVLQTKAVFDQLITLSNKHKNKLLPGYTHLQLAMPNSFGLWFGAYAESLAKNLTSLFVAINLPIKNP